MKRLLAVIAIGFGVLVVAAQGQPVWAGHSNRLAYVADAYHDAVHHFYDEARDVRTLDRYTIRLVDRLDDQAEDFRRVARRPSDLSRVIYEFNEIQSLQPRVESAVFGSGCPIVRAHLSECWNQVLLAYGTLQQHVVSLQSVVVPGTGSCDFHSSSRPWDYRTSYRYPTQDRYRYGGRGLASPSVPLVPPLLPPNAAPLPSSSASFSPAQLGFSLMNHFLSRSR